MCPPSAPLVDVSCCAAAYNQEDGRPRGFAHIGFSNLEGSSKAVQMSGNMMDGREVFIDSAKERDNAGGGGGARSPGANTLHLN